MIATHAYAPAPRRGESDTAHVAPDLADDTVGDLLQTADVVARAHPGADAPCAGDPSCARAGSILLATEDDTVLLCGVHAMASVFTTPGLITLVRPASR